MLSLLHGRHTPTQHVSTVSPFHSQGNGALRDPATCSKTTEAGMQGSLLQAVLPDPEVDAASSQSRVCRPVPAATSRGPSPSLQTATSVPN